MDEPNATATQLPVAFVEKTPDEIAVVNKNKAAKAAKAMERRAIERLHQQFNGKVMRVRMRALGDAAEAMERIGIRKAGYGLYYASGHNALEIIANIEEQIEELKTKGLGATEAVVELRKVQVQLNAQLIALGDSHIEATKEAAVKTSSPVHIAFPAGQPVVVATGTPGASGGTEKALTNGAGNP